MWTQGAEGAPLTRLPETQASAKAAVACTQLVLGMTAAPLRPLFNVWCFSRNGNQ